MVKISKYFLGALCSVTMLFMLTSCVGGNGKNNGGNPPSPKPEYLKVVKAEMKGDPITLVTIQFSEPVMNNSFNVKNVGLEPVSGEKPLEMYGLSCKNTKVVGGDTVCSFFVLGVEVDESYSLIVKKDVTSLSGKQLEKDYEAKIALPLEVTKVTLVKDQNIDDVPALKATVVFNKPIDQNSFNQNNVKLDLSPHFFMLKNNVGTI